MTTEFFPNGVIPAVLLPFDSGLRIDEPAYRSHLRDVVAVDGITAITINGHSQEIHALSADEQKRVLEISIDQVGGKVPIICGIYADSPAQGAMLAKQAEAEGAHALLVFPSAVFMLGSSCRPEMIIDHHRIIADSTSLPIIAFVYPPSSGMGYATQTLVRLAEEIPQVVAIKDGCGNPVQHERNIHALHNLGRPFSVLSTHSSWLLSSLVMGVDGLLSGAGSVIADLQVQMWGAVRAKDLALAQTINDRMWHITDIFYSDPFLDMHNRMKEALVLLKRQECAYVRPPLMKLSDHEIVAIREVLTRAGLLTGLQEHRSKR